MNEITINYAELEKTAFIKIFELADALGCTPLKAAKLYLLHRASEDSQVAA